MACFSRFKLAIRAKDKGFPLSPMSPVFISGPEAFPASDVEDSESDPPRNKDFFKTYHVLPFSYSHLAVLLQKTRLKARG